MHTYNILSSSLLAKVLILSLLSFDYCLSPLLCVSASSLCFTSPKHHISSVPSLPPLLSTLLLAHFLSYQFPPFPNHVICSTFTGTSSPHLLVSYPLVESLFHPFQSWLLFTCPPFFFSGKEWHVHHDLHSRVRLYWDVDFTGDV